MQQVLNPRGWILSVLTEQLYKKDYECLVSTMSHDAKLPQWYIVCVCVGDEYFYLPHKMERN